MVFAIGLVLTSSALALLHATAPDASRTVELIVLVAANVTATLVRFLLFRSWVFPRRTTTTSVALPVQAAPARRTVRCPPPTPCRCGCRR